jgi:hypothetical protein
MTTDDSPSGAAAPTPCIRAWLKSIGTSWREMHVYSIRRTKLRRSLRDAVYRRQSEPLRCHQPRHTGAHNGARHASKPRRS